MGLRCVCESIASIVMDELVQDLVSALEHTSEQSKLGELWEEMVLSPLHRRRQVRRRRVQKHRFEPSVRALEQRRHLWIEASESSLDETSQNSSRNSPPALTTSAANCSNSDDMSNTNHWHSLVTRSTRTGQPSWPESDSLSENNLGRPLKRKRRIKRMNPHIRVRLQHKLKVSAIERKLRPRPSRMQHLSRLKNSAGGWVGRDRQSDGVSLMGKQRWNRKITLEHQDAAEENMSEGESSSTCSSDPGLFTNDEGRQGDDEQSDWFFEGDCGIGSSVANLLPNWDSDNQNSRDDIRPSPTCLPSLRGYCSHLKCLPSAASYIRTNRKGFSSKVCIFNAPRLVFHNAQFVFVLQGNTTPEFVERLRHLSHDRHYKQNTSLEGSCASS
uniref:G patch domain-containing protein 2-like isoform X2 n=1 Tax=Doryrhamphus excisus TaxID=161450 RepID=UPI0025AE9740|nr:G patch domain-containing protein 2-like isoform X2 [Doryrhamphus excisus]